MSKYWLVILALLLTGCTENLQPTPSEPHALAPQQISFISHLWKVTCWGVAPYGDFGLWDDAPGASLHNESAYFWLVTNDPGDEYCIASTSGKSLSTTAYPQLYLRLAVNDGAIFRIELRAESQQCLGGRVIAAISTTRTEAHSDFIIKNAKLPAGQRIDEVCLILDDHPNDVKSQRASALIDEIKIWDEKTKLVGWQETFSRRN